VRRSLLLFLCVLLLCATTGTRPLAAQPTSALLYYAIVWLAFVHVTILVYEEPNLRRTFGSSYERYTSFVRRWVPGKKFDS
jgi:protein-S-isoprenylcysteine O-methyltransferase Ste14